MLRDWLTDPLEFNTSWTDEAAYTELLDLVRDQLRSQRPEARK